MGSGLHDPHDPGYRVATMGNLVHCDAANRGGRSIIDFRIAGLQLALIRVEVIARRRARRPPYPGR